MAAFRNHARRSEPSPGAARAAPLPRDPERATTLLFERDGETVLRYCWHLLGRREDAEDAAQATFLAAHSALSGGTVVLEPRAWLFRIARNECIGRLRARASTPAMGDLAAVAEPAASGPAVERQVELRGEVAAARSALAGLPESQREAYVMREWLGLGNADVALAMGLSVPAVEGLVGRARRELVVAVGGHGETRIGCSATLRSLADGSVDRAARVHLLRCPSCRAARRALAPEPRLAAHGMLPLAALAARIGEALPGFAATGGAAATTLVAKVASGPVLVKAVAALAAVTLAGGAIDDAVRSTASPAAPRRAGASAPTHHARPAAPPPRPAAAQGLSSARLVSTTHAGGVATVAEHGGESHRASHGGRGHGSGAGGQREAHGSGADGGSTGSDDGSRGPGSGAAAAPGSDDTATAAASSHGDGGGPSTPTTTTSSGSGRSGGGDDGSSGRGSGGDDDGQPTATVTSAQPGGSTTPTATVPTATVATATAAESGDDGPGGGGSGGSGSDSGSGSGGSGSSGSGSSGKGSSGP